MTKRLKMLTGIMYKRMRLFDKLILYQIDIRGITLTLALTLLLYSSIRIIEFERKVMLICMFSYILNICLYVLDLGF